MPAPEKAQLEGPIKMLMQLNELKGENAPALAEAIAETVVHSLKLFAKQTMVMPGIPCSPGSTAGPGRLI